LQFRLRPRGSRLKHIGDRRQTNAMSLVGRVERGGRQIQIRFLGVALRPRREKSERRGLDLKNGVLHGGVCVRSAAIAVWRATSMEPERPPKSRTVYVRLSVGPYWVRSPAGRPGVAICNERFAISPTVTVG
jgi:hypothetical protein